MLKLSFLILTIALVSADRPKIFKSQFLQEIRDFETGLREKSGPLVDPPAGHGLPEFSDIPLNLEPDQLKAEIRAWKLAEQAAETEFYEQTNQALVNAQAKRDACTSKYTTQEEIEECQQKAELEIEAVENMITDLQGSHAAEEEAFDSAIEAILEYRELNNDIEI
ncbi:unnamed protein product [Blepharisma stoltei]|uniref:Uncharacterized protein n=1 Tax=Blepharisma stoltei TaxID=1481888 RepID=A0AAU9JD55_9CILI|nr:unnamed protein product [Blepharisma stoltei]